MRKILDTFFWDLILFLWQFYVKLKAKFLRNYASVSYIVILYIVYFNIVYCILYYTMYYQQLGAWYFYIILVYEKVQRISSDDVMVYFSNKSLIYKESIRSHLMPGRLVIRQIMALAYTFVLQLYVLLRTSKIGLIVGNGTGSKFGFNSHVTNVPNLSRYMKCQMLSELCVGDRYIETWYFSIILAC